MKLAWTVVGAAIATSVALGCQALVGLNGDTVVVVDAGTDGSGRVFDAGRDSTKDSKSDSHRVSGLDCGRDSSGEKDAAQSCLGLLPVGTMGCSDGHQCCQTGPGVPVGGGCVALGSSSFCVPRCNSNLDCERGYCCAINGSSTPPDGGEPVEPGGWCLAFGNYCPRGDRNGYVCTGDETIGWKCTPSACHTSNCKTTACSDSELPCDHLHCCPADAPYGCTPEDAGFTCFATEAKAVVACGSECSACSR